MKAFSFFVFLFILLQSCDDPVHITSSKSQILEAGWLFSKEGDKEFYKAEVPGLIHLDLLKNDLIEDPYLNNNEHKLQWIEKENWEYLGKFNIEKSVFQNTHIEMQFDGLDTYANVYINGRHILEADNMFRIWNVEVKDLLKQGENELKITFDSPIEFNKSKVKASSYQLPSGNESSDIETKVSAYTRKASYQFGWDWGPRFVSAGIWRPIKINTWNKARINDVFTNTEEIIDDVAFMRTRLEIEVDEPGEYTLIFEEDTLDYDFKDGINIIDRNYNIEDPILWWCNGKGEAHMYSQNIELYKNEDLIDAKEDRFGIRTIALINEKDSIGTSFYFELNGEAVFMQGANYIPQDIFPTRVSNEQYKKLLRAVKEANMNMLRVWGGGIYEEDLFYDLCDEYGILVWQDFMFAGSLYPDDEEFKENVQQEIRDNVRRLRRHPCIALWCGNNEIEVAWNNWGWQSTYDYSSADSTQIWENYLSIFHKLIPGELADLDQRAYVASSPLSNWGKKENFNHSSMHYWGVWHGREDFDEFENNVGRFMVEYGFQSFPDYESLNKSISDSLMYLESEVMSNRQKSYIGNGMIKDQISKYFPEAASFEEFIILSQKTQAIALEKAIRAHKESQGHCMGSLFWQLNDCWPGPSWSVIDYYGKQKIAYETVKKEFSIQR